MVNSNRIFFKNYIVKANSVKPDQTPGSAASDLVFQCLPMSHKKDVRLKRVNC